MEGMAPTPENGSFQSSVTERKETLMQQRFELQFVGPDDPVVPAAQAVERRVFMEKFHNTDEEMDVEYRQYDPQSLYLVVTDLEADGGPTVAGMIRIIEDGPSGLKSVNDLSGKPWSVPQSDVLRLNPAFGAVSTGKKVWDVATLAVPEEYRGKDNVAGLQTSMALFYGLCRASAENDVDCWVAVLQDKVLEEVIQPIGRPFDHYEDPRLSSAEYLGSISTPVYCDVKGLQARSRREHPDLYATFFGGQGMSQFVSTDSWPTDQVAA
jgi:hypothetical protein